MSESTYKGILLNGDAVELNIKGSVISSVRPAEKVQGMPRLLPALEAVCMKAMSLNPAERYSDPMEIRSDINAILAGYAAEAEQASVMRNCFLFLRRNLAAVTIIILLILSGVLAYLAFLVS